MRFSPPPVFQNVNEIFRSIHFFGRWKKCSQKTVDTTVRTNTHVSLRPLLTILDIIQPVCVQQRHQYCQVATNDISTTYSKNLLTKLPCNQVFTSQRTLVSSSSKTNHEVFAASSRCCTFIVIFCSMELFSEYDTIQSWYPSHYDNNDRIVGHGKQWGIEWKY
jgi:hypothetical protein